MVFCVYSGGFWLEWEERTLVLNNSRMDDWEGEAFCVYLAMTTGLKRE